MPDPLRLMAVLAHPDDESLGCGGTLARYAAEGVETYLVTATLGERGWMGDPADDPGLAEMARIREAELRCAVEALGIRELALLGYIDGDLDQADPGEAAGRIAAHIRRRRPHVVITFGPDGAYGHPDHIAICQFSLEACILARQPDGDLPGHRVDKLYYLATDQPLADAYIAAFGDIAMDVDGVTRRPYWLPDWQVSTLIDASDYWQQTWAAARCHASQLPPPDFLDGISDDAHRFLWGYQPFVRAFSFVNRGRARETDLFEGLR